MESFMLGLLLALLAGFATTIGCIFSLFIKQPNPKFISIVMGFSAGVMILVSFVELLSHSIESNGLISSLLFFFMGMTIMLLIDVSITHEYKFDSIEIFNNNNKECREPQKHHYYRRRHRHRQGADKNEPDLEKISILVFLGIFIHNIPEGMVTFIGTVDAVQLGVILAIAIALHNIPEGIAVSLSVYTCTNDRKKAFFWSFLSGISEFFGALAIGLILYPFINDIVLGAMLAIVAGIMVYISLDELLPASHHIGKEHYSILGIMSGMLVMAISLMLL
jgi:ZIP family zinc transporter